VSEHDPVHDDWERFRALTTMTNHWDRPGWTPGRSAYHWFLTFDNAALRDLATACQRQLRAFDCLDPVPADGLHLTVRRLAFTDEIETADVDTLAARVSDRCRPMQSAWAGAGPWPARSDTGSPATGEGRAGLGAVGGLPTGQHDRQRTARPVTG
jgi:hypothetical protein